VRKNPAGARPLLRLVAGIVVLLLGLALAPALAQGRAQPATTSSTTTSSTTTTSTTTTTTPPPPTSTAPKPTTTTTTEPGRGRSTTSTTVCPEPAGPDPAGSDAPGSNSGGRSSTEGASSAPGGPTTTTTPTSGGAKASAAGCPGGGSAPTQGPPAPIGPGLTAGTGGAAPNLVTPRRRPGVRARRTTPRRPSARAFTGPIVRIVHRSAPPGAVASAGVGPLGPAVTGPLPLNEEEEYVGAGAGLLVPLLLASAALVFGAAWAWERRKDRRVADARRAMTSRVHRLHHRPSERPS
jgi:hypothetical protein